MWKYVKTLQYPINIKKKDLKMAKYLVTQYGGPYYNRDFRKDEVMNNYCKYLRKRKNKPYCNILNKEITYSVCRECVNKEYKKSSYNKKSPITSERIAQSSALSSESSVKSAVKVQYKSKKLKKLERNRRSVFTDDLEHCYLCGKPREHLHEIIYGKNRINSIKYNFVLPLCANHHTGKDGIHFNKELDLYYKRLCQIYFENNIGNRKEFIKIFGRSYL